MQICPTFDLQTKLATFFLRLLDKAQWRVPGLHIIIPLAAPREL